MSYFINFLVILVMTFGMIACNSVDEPTCSSAPQEDDVRVVNLSDYINPTSRNDNDSLPIDENVLRFKDEATYQETIAKLKGMSEVEKRSFFEGIGFEGAYMILSNADKELETLFDNEEFSADSCLFQKAMVTYLEKYDSALEFDTEPDEDNCKDMTPRLSFLDENIELVGSINGYAIVGDSVIYSKKMDVTSQNKIKIKFVKTREVNIKNGKYWSYLYVGRWEDCFAAKVETYRKMFFYKKHDKNCWHAAKVDINDGSKGLVMNISQREGEFYTKIRVRDLSKYLRITITDFRCSRNSNNKISKQFTGVIIK